MNTLPIVYVNIENRLLCNAKCKTNQWLSYIFWIIDQPPLIEGDIVDDERTRAMMEAERRAANGEASAFDASNYGKWKDGIVPYEIDGSLGK